MLAIWLALHGPLSQASLLAKNEQNNLSAIAAAKLPRVTTLPFSRHDMPIPWPVVKDFKPPIPSRNRYLQLLKNGPLEGTPMSENRGIVYDDMILVETHRWINGKTWGVAFVTNNRVLPVPYRMKHIQGNWWAWYMDGNTPPKEPGTWYE